MSDWLGRDNDDYLRDSLEKLGVAEAVIGSAAQVNVADQVVRDSLGRQLATAKNLLLRAQRDIESHRARFIRETDHGRIADYLEEIDYGRDRPQLVEGVHLVIPLPLELDRLTAKKLAPTKAFFNLVSRLVDETVNTNFKKYDRRWLPRPFGSFGDQQLEQNYYHFFTAVREGDREAKMWGVKLYFSGAIAYHFPLSPEGGQISLESFKATLEATMMFAGRVSEEFGIVANRYAIGSVLSHGQKVRLLSNEGELALKDEAAVVVIPSVALIRSLTELFADAEVTADEVSRSLETHFAATHV